MVAPPSGRNVPVGMVQNDNGTSMVPAEDTEDNSIPALVVLEVS